jgi:hypothetical protein
MAKWKIFSGFIFDGRVETRKKSAPVSTMVCGQMVVGLFAERKITPKFDKKTCY